MFMDYWIKDIVAGLFSLIVSLIFFISALYIYVKGKFYPRRMSILSQRHFRRTQRLYISREEDPKEFNRTLYLSIILGMIFLIFGIIVVLDKLLI